VGDNFRKMSPLLFYIYKERNSGLLSKYSSMVFNILTFITIYVCHTSEQNVNKIKHFNQGCYRNLFDLTQNDPEGKEIRKKNSNTEEKSEKT